MTSYFKLCEFTAKLSESERLALFSRSDLFANLTAIFDGLQLLRMAMGSSITITSWYRDPSHNKAAGGSSTSQHLRGAAVDIKVSNVAVLRHALDTLPHPFGYCEINDTYIHLGLAREYDFFYQHEFKIVDKRNTQLNFSL